MSDNISNSQSTNNFWDVLERTAILFILHPVLIGMGWIMGVFWRTGINTPNPTLNLFDLISIIIPILPYYFILVFLTIILYRSDDNDESNLFFNWILLAIVLILMIGFRIAIVRSHTDKNYILLYIILHVIVCFLFIIAISKLRSRGQNFNYNIISGENIAAITAISAFSFFAASADGYLQVYALEQAAQDDCINKHFDRERTLISVHPIFGESENSSITPNGMHSTNHITYVTEIGGSYILFYTPPIICKPQIVFTEINNVISIVSP